MDHLQLFYRRELFLFQYLFTYLHNYQLIDMLGCNLLIHGSFCYSNNFSSGLWEVFHVDSKVPLIHPYHLIYYCFTF